MYRVKYLTPHVVVPATGYLLTAGGVSQLVVGAQVLSEYSLYCPLQAWKGVVVVWIGPRLTSHNEVPVELCSADVNMVPSQAWLL